MIARIRQRQRNVQLFLSQIPQHLRGHAKEQSARLPRPHLDGGDGKNNIITNCFTSTLACSAPAAGSEPLTVNTALASHNNLVPRIDPNTGHPAPSDHKPEEDDPSHNRDMPTDTALAVTGPVPAPHKPQRTSRLAGVTKPCTGTNTQLSPDITLLPTRVIPHPGLRQPVLNCGAPVHGSSTHIHRKQNKIKRLSKQQHQAPVDDWWTPYRGQFSLPPQKLGPTNHRNNMCPTNLALHHPAAGLLLEYAAQGCPVQTGAC